MSVSIQPQEWIRQIVTREGVDTPIAFGLKYVGSEDSGVYEAAATTNDFTLSHGDLSSEAVDTTVGSSGVLDLTTYDTLQKLLEEINSSPNWEAWLVDLPGDYDTNISAGNGIFGTKTSTQAKVANGSNIKVDTSLKTAEDFAAGLTFNGPSTKLHNSDAMVLHEILQIKATATFGGATDGLYIYSCDDRAGTKTEIAHFTLASATATEYPTGGDVAEPLISNAQYPGRLVVMAKDSSGAITSPKIEIVSRSRIIGPAMPRKKLYSNY